MRCNLIFVLGLCLGGTLVAQSPTLELEIADRLTTFERARLSGDYETLLDLTYPELFRLLPRPILTEQLATLDPGDRRAPGPAYVPRFHVLGEPREWAGVQFLELRIEAPNTPPRRVLAVRTDAELKWFFLDLNQGNEELLAEIIPPGFLPARR